MNEEWQIYFNPSCTKCNITLGLLKERGIEPEVVKYLDTPPTKALLLGLLTKLDLPAKAIIRDSDLTKTEDVIEAIVNKPELLQRPIIVRGSRAVIGRPPENVLKLFE